MHITAKDRTKAAARRIWARHWFNGPEGKAVFRSVMDRVMERAIGDVYGIDVAIQGGKMTRATFANGETREFA